MHFTQYQTELITSHISDIELYLSNLQSDIPIGEEIKITHGKIIMFITHDHVNVVDLWGCKMVRLSDGLLDMQTAYELLQSWNAIKEQLTEKILQYKDESSKIDSFLNSFIV